jgi:hypothetical protein
MWNDAYLNTLSENRSKILLIEQGLREKSTAELEEIARDGKVIRGMLEIRNSFSYDISQEKYEVAIELLRRRGENVDSLQTS